MSTPKKTTLPDRQWKQISKLTPKMGRLVRVENQNPRRLANPEYLSSKIELEDGTERYALFTDAEVRKACIRADKNPEDWAKVSTIRNIFD